MPMIWSASRHAASLTKTRARCPTNDEAMETEPRFERAIEQDRECTRVLQQATSCRGTLDGFIAEVIEDHIREHMIDPASPHDDPRTVAAEELVEIVHAYLT